MDPIYHDAFLDNLLGPGQLQHHQQPSTPFATSASISNSLQVSPDPSPVAAPHVWDEEALDKMMKSSPDDTQGPLQPPLSPLSPLSLDYSLATRHRSMAPSPPIIPSHLLGPCGGGCDFNYFGTVTAQAAAAIHARVNSGSTTNYQKEGYELAAASAASCASDPPTSVATELVIQIPYAEPQHQHESMMVPFEWNLNSDSHNHLSCDSIIATTDPTSLSNVAVVAPLSQSTLVLPHSGPTPMYTTYPPPHHHHHQQQQQQQLQFFNNQGLGPMSPETLPFYDVSSPVRSHLALDYQSTVLMNNMVKLHQHQKSSSLLTNGFSTSATAAAAPTPSFSSPSSAIPDAPVANSSVATTAATLSQHQTSTLLSNNGISNTTVTAAAGFPSTANYNSDYSMATMGGFNPTSPEHLSDLSSLFQQRQCITLQQRQQQQQHLQQIVQQQQQLASSRPPPSPLSSSHQNNNHTSVTQIDNRNNNSSNNNNSTRQYSFMRPLNANSFAQSMYYPSPSVEHSASTTPSNNAFSSSTSSSSTDTTHHHFTTSNIPSSSPATKRRLGRPPLDRMPPSHPTPTTTTPMSPSSSFLSTMSRPPSPGSSGNNNSSSGNRQTSRKKFYIVEPYQHTDQKVDRRSFNSRKQLRQLQAQEQSSQAHKPENEQHQDHQDYQHQHCRQSSS